MPTESKCPHSVLAEYINISLNFTQGQCTDTRFFSSKPLVTLHFSLRLVSMISSWLSIEFVNFLKSVISVVLLVSRASDSCSLGPQPNLCDRAGTFNQKDVHPTYFEAFEDERAGHKPMMRSRNIEQWTCCDGCHNILMQGIFWPTSKLMYDEAEDTCLPCTAFILLSCATFGCASYTKPPTERPTETPL